MTCTVCHRECPLVAWSERAECPYCQGAAYYCGRFGIGGPAGVSGGYAGWQTPNLIREIGCQVARKNWKRSTASSGKSNWRSDTSCLACQ